MSYSQTSYNRIFATLKKFGSKNIAGQAARRLIVFALMITGLVRAGKIALDEMADKSTKHKDSKTESRTKRFNRWLRNKKVNKETMYFPYIKEILAGLSGTTLIFTIDASSLGKHCAVLMISIIYKGRALPVIWKVREGNKGSFSEAEHVVLLEELYELLQEIEEDLEKELDVVVVGDGEFDGVEFQKKCEEYKWEYVLRAAKNINCYEEEEKEPFKPEDIAQEGEQVNVERVKYTKAKYGPVQIIAWWEEEYKEPIYLVTNVELAKEACESYRKRSLIETFFSDEKSRGFNIHKTRIKDPKRLEKLLLVACFAYIWIVYLGAIAKKEGKEGQFRRKDRKVLSLFQLGRKYLEYLLECAIPIPEGLLESPEFWEESAWI